MLLTCPALTHFKIYKHLMFILILDSKINFTFTSKADRFYNKNNTVFFSLFHKAVNFYSIKYLLKNIICDKRTRKWSGIESEKKHIKYLSRHLFDARFLYLYHRFSSVISIKNIRNIKLL